MGNQDRQEARPDRSNLTDGDAVRVTHHVHGIQGSKGGRWDSVCNPELSGNNKNGCTTNGEGIEEMIYCVCTYYTQLSSRVKQKDKIRGCPTSLPLNSPAVQRSFLTWLSATAAREKSLTGLKDPPTREAELPTPPPRDHVSGVQNQDLGPQSRPHH